MGLAGGNGGLFSLKTGGGADFVDGHLAELACGGFGGAGGCCVGRSHYH